MSSSNPLRIFVAMPGTDMGPHATYKNPESVKENLLKPVADDYWRLFDLADALLFSGEPEESVTLFNRAVGLVPIDERKDKLLSVLGPLRDYLAAGVLNEPLRGKVEEVVNGLESARGAI